MTTRARLLLAIAYPLGVAVLSLALPLALNVRDRVGAEVRNEATAQATLLAAAAADLAEPDERPDVQALAEQASRRAHGRFVIVDADGLLVADSAGSTPPGTLLTSRPEIRQALTGRRVQLERHSATLRTDLLATAVPIVHGNRTAGAIRLTQSMAAVHTATRRAALGIAALAAIVLGLGLAGATLIASQLSRSTRRLHTAVGRVSAGDLEARAPVEGASEQRELAVAFNAMTERVGRMLGAQADFVADASHQLRTPLAGARLQVEEVLHGDDLDDARRGATTALDELDRLARTVDELLVLSGERGATTTVTDVRLDEEARAAADRWEARAAQRDQTITVRVDRVGAPVTASRDDVARALDALVENAVAYGPDGQAIVLAVDGRRVDVLDEGPGLSAGEEEVVFERFHRGSAAASARGSGLGLAVARQLARRNGGDAGIANRTDGRGACATLELTDA